MKNNDSSKAIVIDTPAGIEAFRLLAIKNALKFEVECPGMRLTRNARPLALANQVMGTAIRNKAKCLKSFEEHLRKIGVLIVPAQIKAAN